MNNNIGVTLYLLGMTVFVIKFLFYLVLLDQLEDTMRIWYFDPRLGPKRGIWDPETVVLFFRIVDMTFLWQEFSL